MSIQLLFDKWLGRFEPSHFEWLLTFTAIITLTWIVLAVFVAWRRAVTNLTPVDLPAANPDARPDFLQVDHRKRQQALQRGDAYAAGQDSPHAPGRRVTLLKTVCGWLAISLATAALAVYAVGSVWPESFVGNWLK